ARSVIGVGGHAVGEGSDHVGADVLGFVQARHHQHAEGGNGGGQKRKERAQILDDLELDAGDGAVAHGRDFVEIHVAAAVNGALEIFAAGFDPLHRLFFFLRDESNQELFV